MRFHHVGKVVKNIKLHLRHDVFSNAGEIVYDPLQDANLCLIPQGDISIELVQPMSENSKTYKFLRSGGGLHHICYEVDSQEEVEMIIENKRMVRVYGPVPALLFNDRHVTFVYSRNNELIEFLCKQNETKS